MTQSFNDILNDLRSTLPPTSPLEPIILQSILACLIVRDKHLILHTVSEDVRLVARLAVWTLSFILGLSTHKLKIKPRQSVTEASIASANPQPHFLRSLFLPVYRDSTEENPNTDLSPSHIKYIRPRYPKQKSPVRSQDVTSPAATSLFAEASYAPPLHHTPKKRGRVSENNIISRELPQALVISGLHHASRLSQCALAQVLSEKRVVLDKNPGQITADEDGVWNLPEGFLVIYVCPFDSRERPAIHKTLLDRFSMSVPIIVQQHTRQALRALSERNPISAIPSVSSPVQHLQHSQRRPSHNTSPRPLSPTRAQFDPLIHSQLHTGQNIPRSPPTPPTSPSYSHHPLVSIALIKSFRAQWKQTAVAPSISLYLADLFSAVRHHPELDGMLLTVRSQNDAVDLAKAYRVLGVNRTGMELIRPDNYETLQRESTSKAKGKKKEEWKEDGQYANTINDDETSNSPLFVRDYHRRPSEVSSTYQSARSQETFGQKSLLSNLLEEVRRTGEQPQLRNIVLDVTEADIARVVPRVVTHRLRVRDGPQDEILASLRYGATSSWTKDEVDGGVTDETGAYSRSTIKDILIKILTDV